MKTNTKTYLALTFSAALITTSFAGPGNAAASLREGRLTVLAEEIRPREAAAEFNDPEI